MKRTIRDSSFKSLQSLFQRVYLIRRATREQSQNDQPRLSSAGQGQTSECAPRCASLRHARPLRRVPFGGWCGAWLRLRLRLRLRLTHSTLRSARHCVRKVCEWTNETGAQFDRESDNDERRRGNKGKGEGEGAKGAAVRSAASVPPRRCAVRVLRPLLSALPVVMRSSPCVFAVLFLRLRCCTGCVCAPPACLFVRAAPFVFFFRCAPLRRSAA